MNQPKQECFELLKAKLVKDGGLDCQFEINETFKDQTFYEKYHNESSKDIHPDLVSLFKDLKPYVARIFHWTGFLNMMEDDNFMGTAPQKKFAKKLHNELMDKIKIRSISLSGSDDKRGVVISAVFVADSNMPMAINTHRIKFNDQRYGFEDEIEGICSNIEDEVYEFLFNDKAAQLTLFSGGEPNVEEAEVVDVKAAAAGEK